MKKQGIEKAAARLISAELALRDAKLASNQISFYRAWSEFLTSVDAVYNCYGQSIGVCQRSAEWFKELSGLRKSDPMLQYLWQARNVDNHGIEAPAEFVPGSLSIGGGRDLGFSREISINLDFDEETQTQHILASPLDGKPVRFENTPPKALLLPVENRGVTYKPPSSHLGQPLDTSSPLDVGDLTLKYFSKRHAEAVKLMS